MDSTLSKASRAIKKTSKKVTRAFSFTKTPKRVLQRAFLANSTPDEKAQSCENHIGSSSTLAMSRSASTFSISDTGKSSAVVQRSNSLDHPPVRARVPVCPRTPCSAAQKLILSPGPYAASESNYCPSTRVTKSTQNTSLLTQPAPPNVIFSTSQQSTSMAITAIEKNTPLHSTSKHTIPKSRQLTSAGLQPKSVAPLPSNAKERTFSESCSDPKVSLEPRKVVLTSPRRETLL